MRPHNRKLRKTLLIAPWVSGAWLPRCAATACSPTSSSRATRKRVDTTRPARHSPARPAHSGLRRRGYRCARRAASRRRTWALGARRPVGRRVRQHLHFRHWTDIAHHDRPGGASHRRHSRPPPPRTDRRTHPASSVRDWTDHRPPRNHGFPSTMGRSIAHRVPEPDRAHQFCRRVRSRWSTASCRSGTRSTSSSMPDCVGRPRTCPQWSALAVRGVGGVRGVYGLARTVASRRSHKEASSVGARTSFR